MAITEKEIDVHVCQSELYKGGSADSRQIFIGWKSVSRRESAFPPLYSSDEEIGFLEGPCVNADNAVLVSIKAKIAKLGFF